MPKFSSPLRPSAHQEIGEKEEEKKNRIVFCLGIICSEDWAKNVFLIPYFVCLCVRVCVGFSSYNIAGGLFAQLGTAINTHSLSLSLWRFRVY
jgi:hypothetical protein